MRVEAQIAEHVADAKAMGNCFLMLAIGGRARRTGKRIYERVRVAPGLLGRLRNELPRPDGRADFVVEVAVADAEAWLARRGARP